MGGREGPDKERYYKEKQDTFSFYLPKLRTAGPAQDGAFRKCQLPQPVDLGPLCCMLPVLWVFNAKTTDQH